MRTIVICLGLMVLSTTPAYAAESSILYASAHVTIHLTKDEAWIAEQIAEPEFLAAAPMLDSSEEFSDGGEDVTIATDTDLISAASDEEQASADESALDEAPTVTAEPVVEAEAPVPDEIEGEPQ